MFPKLISSQLPVTVRLIKTVPVDRGKKTAIGLAHLVIKVIKKCNDNLNNIRFQTYGRASTMSGKCTSVQKNISGILERLIIYIACLPHDSNLVIKHRCRASYLITNIMTFRSNIRSFTGCTKRFGILGENLEEVGNSLQL